MDFFGNIAQNVGNFFSGIFGGNDDEERKRREREARQRQQQQQAQMRQQAQRIAQMPQVLNQQGQQEWVRKNVPNAAPQVDRTRNAMTIDQFMNTGRPQAMPRPTQPKPQPKRQPNAADAFFQGAGKAAGDIGNVLGTAGKGVFDFFTDNIQKAGQTIGRDVETQQKFASKGGNALVNDKFFKSEMDEIDRAERAREITPQRAAELRADRQKKREEALKAAESTKKEYKQKYGEELRSQDERFWDVALGAFDLATLGVGGAVVKSGKLTKAGLEKLAQAAEKNLGRDLTEDEIKSLATEAAKRAEQDAAKRSAEKATPKKAGSKADDVAETAVEQLPRRAEEAPSQQIPLTPMEPELPINNLPSKEEVADSYKNVFNKINDDANLTPEQKTSFQEEAKRRHADLIKQIDDSAAAQEKVVNDAAQAQADQARQLQETTAAVQQAQQEAVTPPAGSIETPAQVERAVNDVYTDSIRQMDESADAIRQAQQVDPVKKWFDAVRREGYDPLLLTQRLDNRIQGNSNLRPGQRELLPEQSVVAQQQRIANPDQAVRAELRDSNVRKVIQTIARKGKDYESDFERYRMFRDELWHMSPEGGSNPNTLSVPAEEMAAFVRQMDERSPEMNDLSTILRQFSLDNMRRRVDAGIDSREHFEASARNPYYTPRRQVKPKDEVRPTTSSIFNRGAKSTKSRTGEVSNVESPLELFEQDIRDTIRGEAAQQRASILRNAGFEVTDSAEDNARRRDLVRTMGDLAEQVRGLKGVAKGARKEMKDAKVATQAKTDAIEKTRQYLVDQATDERGVRFANRISDKEALDMFKLMTEAGEVSGTRLINRMAKDTGSTPDEIKDFITGVRQEIKDAKQAGSDAFGEMTGIAKNPRTGQTEISYKSDGATGKIAIPAEIADEWAKLDAMFDRSPVGKFIDSVASGFKVTWTGMLAPVFQLKQIIMNGGLMFRNADGLSGVDHQALAGLVKGLVFGNNQFRRDLMKQGAQYETATRTLMLRRSIIDDIKATSNLGNFLNRSPIQTAGDVGRGLNRMLAHVSNAQRDAVARGAYARAKRLGFTDDQAMQAAAQAPAKVFGDFNRVSRLARNLETVMPYSGAIQAGARSIARASKTKPIETAVKDAIVLSSIGGIVAWNLNNGAEEYYKAMEESGQEYDADQNLIIANGEVSQNPDGSWNNIIKVPLTPDFRPINRAVIDTLRGIANEEGVDPAMLGAEVFNFFTGDSAGNLFDPNKTDNGQDIMGGVFAGSPVLNTGRILANRNIYQGGEMLNDYMRSRPSNEQAFDSTSNAARAASDITGGAITPIQFDQLFGQLGGAGRTIKGIGDEKSPNPLAELFDVGSAFTPKKGATEDTLKTRQYFENVDAIGEMAPDEATYNAFMSLHSKKNERSKENMLNSANKAAQFMEYAGDGFFFGSQLYEMEKALDARQREQGQPGNPLFDLAPQQLQRVLTYRSMKIPNAAGQSYSKGGQAAFTALGLDEKWYQQFRDAESNYYNQTLGESDAERKTFSGKAAPQLTDQQRQLQNQYFSLPEKSPERRAFLQANPWLKEYWEKDNDFTQEERKALGFEIEDNQYSSGGRGRGGYGRRGGGGEYEDTENALNRILNEGDFQRLLDLAGGNKQVAVNLQRFFAPRRGGRANVKLGASARGNS